MARYTEALVAKLTELIRDGLTLRRACIACGLAYTTACKWRRAEKAGDVRYAGLTARLEEAAAQSEADSLRVIKAAARDGAWQAAAWLLERRYPDQYGRREPRDRGRPQAQEVRPADSPEYLAAALAFVAAAQHGPAGPQQSGGAGDGGIGRSVATAAAPGVAQPQTAGGVRPTA